MVNKIAITLIASIFLFGCSKKLDELMMSKQPYLGNGLKINGYYYSNETSESNVGLAIFYRDGFCIHMFVRPEHEDINMYLEEEIIMNEEFISEIKERPSWIGVFDIENDQIEFETWEFGGDGITTFSHFGEISNDTTFMTNRRVNNGSNKTITEDLIYRFKAFSPKPDSTNMFIQ